MARSLEKGLIFIKTEKFMKVSFVMIQKMGLGRNCNQMVLFMKDSFKMAIKKEKEGFNGPMARSMMASGKTIVNMAVDFGRVRTGHLI